MKIDIMTKEDKRPMFVDLDDQQTTHLMRRFRFGSSDLRIYLKYVIRPVVEKLIEEATNK